MIGFWKRDQRWCSTAHVSFINPWAQLVSKLVALKRDQTNALFEWNIEEEKDLKPLMILFSVIWLLWSGCVLTLERNCRQSRDTYVQCVWRPRLTVLYHTVQNWRTALGSSAPGISALVVSYGRCGHFTQRPQTSPAAAGSAVSAAPICRARLKVSQFYFEEKTLSSVKKAQMEKPIPDMQTDHMTECVSLSSHFSSFMVSLCFSEEEKKTAAWHQVWNSLPARSFLTVLTPALPPSVSNKKEEASGRRKNVQFC